MNSIFFRSETWFGHEVGEDAIAAFAAFLSPGSTNTDARRR
jgi:hypothetical protein